MKHRSFKKIYGTVFDDPRDWQEWFLGNVVTDDNEIYLAADAKGEDASALLMQPYGFRYWGETLSAGYISCFGTLPEARSQGLGGKLLEEALAAGHQKGYALCGLVPAEEHLYFYYRRHAFAPVFYADCRRYVASHMFKGGEAGVVKPTYRLFELLEYEMQCGIVHSESDYGEICAALALEAHPHHIAVEDAAGESAMLFAVESDSGVTVKSLLAQNEDCARCALRELGERTQAKAMTVLTPPESNFRAYLRPCGMMRITDAGAVLAALARSHPGLHTTISLHDRLMPQNEGTYHIGAGECVRTGGKMCGNSRNNLETTVETLTEILFGDSRTGSIFGLPSVRPYMALMLD